MLIIVLPSIAHASLTADQAANIVLGQPNLYTGSPNQQSVLNLKDLSAPFSATFDSSGNLWVADSGNNRVLEFKPPFSTNEVAAVVIGQPNMFSSGCATTPTGLCQPFSLAFDPTGNLWISDSANNRVLEFLSSNLITGDGASNVLGQPNLVTSACTTTPTGLCNPYSLAFDPSGNLWISDQDNNRVLEYLSSNLITGDGAANVLGQPDLVSNTCTYNPPTSTGLCDPFSLAFDPSGNLWISDNNNNRVLEYLSSNLITGDGAANVLGQPNMFSKGCTSITSKSICYPEGITFDPSGNLWISDSSNSRVLEYLSSNLITGDGAANVLGEPNFVTINGCTTTPVGLCGPKSLTFDPSGNLWISDYQNSRVVEYLSSNLITGSPATIVIGQPSLYTGSQNQQGVINLKDLSSPFSATFDSSGNLWVADSNNNRVLEFKPPFSTNEVASVVLGQPNMFSSGCATTPTGLCQPFSLAFDPTGNLWISDTGNTRVVEYLSSNLITGDGAANVLGQPDFISRTCTISPTGLCSPQDLNFDPSGNLWISDTENNRIVEYLSSNLITGDGAANVLGQSDFTSRTCATTPTGLCEPYGITFDPSGNLWISDQGNQRVVEYLSSNLITGDGAANVLGEPDMFSSACTLTPTGLCNPQGLTFDPTGNLWISDQYNQRVVEYLSSNLITGDGAANVLGEPDMFSSACATTPTGFCDPEGLAFDPSGNLWISDIGNNRVLEYLSSNLITGSTATIAIGQPNLYTGSTNQQGNPNSKGLEFPASAVFDSSGNLWVADFINSRVLEFKPPFSTNEVASVVLGQQDMFSSGCTTTPTGLCYPSGLAFDPSGNLWISDFYNNRVLEFPSSNLVTDGEASVVLGQPDFTSSSPNQGGALSSTTLYYPTNVTFDSSGNLWISDFYNNRILEFPSTNLVTDGAASVVLGQPDFSSNSQNQGSIPSPTTLNNPIDLVFDPRGNLWVTDQKNNRILEFPSTNLVTDGAASVVLGQPDFSSNSPNQGGIPSPTTLNYPSSVTFDSSGNLWVADSYNNRILEFPSTNLVNDASANVVLGQPNLVTNNGCTTSPTGLCYPSGITFDPTGNLWVDDSGNNRVLEYLNPLSVSCSPASFTTSESTTCTATLNESGTDGESMFFSSSDSSTGSFTSASCALSSGSCSVAYSDTATGTPTITATYLGDSTYSESSANTMLTITATTPNGGLHIVNSGGGGAGGSGATTSTIAPTSTATSTAITTSSATTTIFVIFNSSYNITPDSNTIINVPDSGTTIVLGSVSSSGSVSVIITNVTGSTTTSPQSYKLLEALNVSTMPPLNITITVTMEYNCSLPSNSIAPYELTGTGIWNPINPFTVNSTACTVTFAIPTDPIVGIFQYQQPATTSTVLPITTSLATSITTTVPASAASSKSSNTPIWVAIIVIAIVILAILYLFIFRGKKKS